MCTIDQGGSDAADQQMIHFVFCESQVQILITILFFFIYMCVCVCVCVVEYMHMSVCVYVSVCVCVCMHVHAHMHVCMYIYLGVCVCYNDNTENLIGYPVMNCPGCCSAIHSNMSNIITSTVSLPSHSVSSNFCSLSIKS